MGLYNGLYNACKSYKFSCSDYLICSNCSLVFQILLSLYLCFQIFISPYLYLKLHCICFSWCVTVLIDSLFCSVCMTCEKLSYDVFFSSVIIPTTEPSLSKDVTHLLKLLVFFICRQISNVKNEPTNFQLAMQVIKLLCLWHFCYCHMARLYFGRFNADGCMLTVLRVLNKYCWF
jgi:hypothetical protein